MKRPTHLTAGEFELMQVLWAVGEASVRDVWQRVGSKRRLAYTTVMTVLDKMRRKGVLRQRKQGKAYFYSPALGREEALRAIVDYVTDTYFDGSRKELVRFVSDGASVATQPTTRPTRAVEENAASGTAEIDEFLL